jgi:simple sugar transport system permease protein
MRFDVQTNPNDVWYILFIALALVLIIFVIFKYTTFGFTLRVNGLNKDAAKYGGINTKKTTILSMMLSGSIIGVAGFVYYSTLEGQMPDLGESLNTLGFEAITVTLLAFSSPLGMPIAGFFYAMMKSSSLDAGLAAGVSIETFSLVMGIIILFSALTPIFEKTRITRKLISEIKFLFDNPTKNFKKNYKIKKINEQKLYKQKITNYEIKNSGYKETIKSIQNN